MKYVYLCIAMFFANITYAQQGLITDANTSPEALASIEAVRGLESSPTGEKKEAVKKIPQHASDNAKDEMLVVIEPIKKLEVAADKTNAAVKQSTQHASDNTKDETLIPSSTSSTVNTNVSPVLPHDLSPWGMFVAADWIVKIVMIGLAIASFSTWTVLVAKTRELRILVKQQKNTLKIISTEQNLKLVLLNLEKGDINIELIQAATEELKLSSSTLADTEGVKERITSSLERLEVSIGRNVAKGTGILATIGSTAPFVGLFGTVWGIMNSFIGIAETQTTNLAVVAPGIAEALLATAFGLVAAIPAVVIYNYFARKISAYKALVSDTSAAILRLVSRDLSRFSINKEPIENKA